MGDGARNVAESMLVGVTDAVASRRAIEWACRRAEERGSRIELISIVGGAVGAVGEGAVVAEALALTEAMLEREAERARARGLHVEVRLARGNPVDELVDASMVFDLLVIGSDYRGPRSGPRRGPHGVRIVAAAHCPVAVIPDIDLDGRQGVLVGVDGSPFSAKAIEFAAAEAAGIGDPLTLVHAWTTVPLPLAMHAYPAGYLAGMQKLGEEMVAEARSGIVERHPDLEVRGIVERGHPGVVLGRLSAEARTTVVGSHGRGPLARLLLGSTSHEVLSWPVSATIVVR